MGKMEFEERKKWMYRKEIQKKLSYVQRNFLKYCIYETTTEYYFF